MSLQKIIEKYEKDSLDLEIYIPDKDIENYRKLRKEVLEELYRLKNLEK